MPPYLDPPLPDSMATTCDPSPPLTPTPYPNGQLQKPPISTLPFSHRALHTHNLLLPILHHTPPSRYLLPYDRSPFPGELNLSTAENWLLRDMLVAKYTSYLTANLGISSLSYLPGLGGTEELREALAGFFNTYFKPAVEVSPLDLVTGPGASSLLEAALFNVCNPGEAVIVGRPYWPGFDECTMGLGHGNALRVVGVDLPFRREEGVPADVESVVELYEEALERDRSNRRGTVRALVLCNPHNPSGVCYSKEVLEGLLRLAERWGLWVVVDEVYGLSWVGADDGAVHSTSGFNSILSVDCAAIGVNPGRVLVVYSFSKDFGSSGLRLGVCVTQTAPSEPKPSPLRNVLAASQTAKVSTFTNIVVTALLLDEHFMRRFVTEFNPAALGRAWGVLRGFLEWHGIGYVRPQAGVFAWIDFFSVERNRNRNRGQSEGSRYSEEELNKRFLAMGVKLSPGYKYHCAEKGWFRLVFAVEAGVLVEGLKRIERVLGLAGWECDAVTQVEKSRSFS